MYKIVLCVSMLFNNAILESKNVSVEKIEYSFSNYTNEIINLDIELYSKSKDIIEMKIYFFDKEKENKYKNYYSSALSIDGYKKTIAKIPFELKENIFLNIIFYSNNLNDEIENIMFPIYFINDKTCYLHERFICESEMPTKVVYENKKICEKYDRISLINKNLHYYSFSNILPIDNIKISYLFMDDGYANLYIKDNVKEFTINYDGGYIFPLVINNKNNVSSFSFENKYFVDIKKGVFYEDYYDNCLYVNKIILPYLDKEYSMEIQLIDCFASFSKVIIEFKVTTSGILFGDCSYSKYCFRREYL